MDIAMIFLGVGLLLLFAKVLGALTDRFGMSSLVGEICAGIILGPIAGLISMGGFMENFLTFAIVILLFLAGLQVKFDDIRTNSYIASALALGGGMLSFVFGTIVGIVFFNSVLAGFAIGVIILSTSDSILVALLTKTNQLNTHLGKVIIAGGIADDILGPLVIALFSVYAMHESLSINNISALFFIAIGLYLVTMTAGDRIVKQILKIFNKFKDDQILFAIPIALTLLLAFATDRLQLSVAVGAFLSGMIMANSDFASIIDSKVKDLGHGFLIPLFFASIGTLLVFEDINPIFVVAIAIAAMGGKFIGAALVSKLSGFRGNEIKIIGVSLMPRGSENIALAQLLFALGLISVAIYTSVVFAIVLTVIISPILLRLFK